MDFCICSESPGWWFLSCAPHLKYCGSCILFNVAWQSVICDSPLSWICLLDNDLGIGDSYPDTGSKLSMGIEKWMSIYFVILKFIFLYFSFLSFFPLSFFCFFWLCLYMSIESTSLFAIIVLFRKLYLRFPMVFMLISLLGESEIFCYNTTRFLNKPSWLLVESFEWLYYNKVDLEPEEAEFQCWLSFQFYGFFSEVQCQFNEVL